MNKKILIIAIIITGIIIFFLIIKKITPSLNQKILKDIVFSTVENSPKIKDRVIKYPEYPGWDKKIDIRSIDVSQKAAKGVWWQKDAWDWIAWQQTDDQWKVLLSFNGFNCQELKTIPTRYIDFFKDIVYISGKEYCY